MKCTECGGKIDQAQKVRLPIGPMDFDYAFPCTSCGRLHWPDGKGVSNRQTRKKAYWLNGQVLSSDL